MKAFGLKMLGLAAWTATAVWFEPWEVLAGVALQPGTTTEFATVQRGRAALGTRDEFVQAMSQFDRCVRMKTRAAVTEEQFLTHVQNQVQAWSAAEQVKLSNVVGSISGSLSRLNIAFPSTVWLIKTTGREEANAAYCRSNAIIFPQAMVSGSSDALRRAFAHELFHVHSQHRPDLRAALYGVLGFQPCPALVLPQSLLDLKITNPDACRHDFVIHVKLEGQRVPVVPVLYSSSATYTAGDLRSYLISKLLVLEEAGTGWCPRLTATGEPMVVGFQDVTDLYEQTGYNTDYNLHPEETLAENFMQVVLGIQQVSAPRIHYLLQQVLRSGSPLGLSAGRFAGILKIPDGLPQLLEFSADLREWHVCDGFVNTTGSLEICDPTAWLGGDRFFRTRTAELAPLPLADTNLLVWIPPGTFMMGSPAHEAGRASNEEGPQHRATLTHGFRFGRFEVTQGEPGASSAAAVGTPRRTIAGRPRAPVPRPPPGPRHLGFASCWHRPHPED